MRGRQVLILGRLAPWWERYGTCKCGEQMLMAANEGTCVKCGTGAAYTKCEFEFEAELRSLPQDLGRVLADQLATGRRLPPIYGNVISIQERPARLEYVDVSLTVGKAA